ncbi:hypothetical protein V1278_007403 [Bradyrhizobium sp. AZCC 1577]
MTKLSARDRELHHRFDLRQQRLNLLTVIGDEFDGAA